MNLRENAAWIRQFSVNETKRHPKGFTIYKITSNVFPRHNPEAFTTVTVWKRYNEIHKLYQELKNRHKNLAIKDVFPTMSRGTYFNRFDNEVIENRKKSVLSFLSYIAHNTHLFTSQCFVKFFETTQLPNGNDSGNIAAIRCSLSLPKEDDILSIKSMCNESETESAGSNTSQSDSSNVFCGSSEKIQQTKMGSSLLSNLEPNNACEGSSSANSEETNDVLKTLKSKIVESLDAGSSNSSSSSSTVDVLCGDASETSSLTNITTNKTLETDYIFEAAYHFSRAAQCEASKQYNVASDLYRAGIDCLQSGIEFDTDLDRCMLLISKTNKYKKHEQLIRRLSSETDIAEDVVDYQRITRMNLQIGNLERPLEELSNYHVLAVLDTVLLVSHVKTKKCYVIKTIYKSADSNKIIQNIFPYEVPFMVPIVHYFQSETTVFLLLKQASGGKLWDRIKSFVTNESCSHDKHSQNIDVNSIITEPHAVSSSSTAGITEDERSKDSGFLDLINEYRTNRRTETIADHKNIQKTRDLNDVTEENGESPDKNQTIDSATSIDEVDNYARALRNIDSGLHRELETENLLENATLLIKSVSETLNLVRSNDSKVCPTEEEIDVTTRSCHSLNLMDNITEAEDCLAALCEGKDDDDDVECNKMGELNRSRADFLKDDVDDGDGQCLRIDEDMYDALDVSSYIAVNMLPQCLLAEWAAELLLAIEHLHNWGVLCGAILPDDLLLGKKGQLMLSYRSAPRQRINRTSTPPGCNRNINNNNNNNAVPTAPELRNPLAACTEASDWWSYGAALYHVITGCPLQKQHPHGVTEHTILQVPPYVSEEATSLLTGLLQGDATERLGCDPTRGVDEIKRHPFFAKIDWHDLKDSFTYCNVEDNEANEAR